MCLFKKKGKNKKEITINYYQLHNENEFRIKFGKNYINKDIYTCLTDNINIGTFAKSRFKYYYSKLPKNKLLIKIIYSKDKYNVITLSNTNPTHYLDTYIEKTKD